MDSLIAIIQVILSALIAYLLQEIRWRRKQKRAASALSARACCEFLVASDLAFSAAQETARLSEGLHWWNGRERLRLMKATRLDDRLLESSENLAEMLAKIRTYGTTEARKASEEMLTAVASVLRNRQVDFDAQLEAYTQRRNELLQAARAC